MDIGAPRLVFSQENVPSPKTILSAATTVLFRTIANDLLSDSVRRYFSASFRHLSNHFSSQLTVQGFSLTSFEAANTYLASKISPSTRRIKITKPAKENEFTITIDKNQEIVDLFNGVELSWVSQSTRTDKSSNAVKKSKSSTSMRNEVRFFELSFHKKHKDMVLSQYLPYILPKTKAIREENKTLKLHTVDYNGDDYWGWTRLDHPARFETMAMKPETKEELIDDLGLFIERKAYYRRVGKAWKRWYLLHGPPGTGKLSLVWLPWLS